jgi:TPR repeat protein
MAASSNKEEPEQLTQQIEDLSIKDNNMLTTCANCGKEGTDLNVCNKCDLAAYCNAACKKKHRTKHKKKCERRVAELHDKKLFKLPPPKEDCPICMLPLPTLYTGYKYRSCCGKIICSGCIYAVAKRDGGVSLCPFCRTPGPTKNEDTIIQVKKRMEIGDAEAIRNLGCCYADGLYGLPHDYAKALELWHQAAELGNTISYCSIGHAYNNALRVESDEKKAVHYWELAAMGGDADARYNLGAIEGQAGNMGRALKHWMISVGCGDNDSLEDIKQMFMNGDATKEDYAKALLAYQAYLVEIKSPQRDEAAATYDNYKYY